MLPAILLLVVLLGVAFFSQFMVSRAFGEYGDEELSCGTTGAEVAERILERAGVQGVKVEERDACLSDYYDAPRRRLVLSSETFHGSNAGAVGVAGHEAGHAIQQQAGSAGLAKRLSAIRATHLLGGLIFWAAACLGIARLVPAKGAIWIVVAGWGALLLWNLMTMGVEFDASRRGLEEIEGGKILAKVREREAVEATIAAAAWLRVGDVLASPRLIAYYLLPFVGWRK